MAAAQSGVLDVGVDALRWAPVPSTGRAGAARRRSGQGPPSDRRGGRSSWTSEPPRRCPAATPVGIPGPRGYSYVISGTIQDHALSRTSCASGRPAIGSSPTRPTHHWIWRPSQAERAESAHGGHQDRPGLGERVAGGAAGPVTAPASTCSPRRVGHVDQDHDLPGPQGQTDGMPFGRSQRRVEHVGQEASQAGMVG